MPGLGTTSAERSKPSPKRVVVGFRPAGGSQPPTRVCCAVLVGARSYPVGWRTDGRGRGRGRLWTRRWRLRWGSRSWGSRLCLRWKTGTRSWITRRARPAARHSRLPVVWWVLPSWYGPLLLHCRPHRVASVPAHHICFHHERVAVGVTKATRAGLGSSRGEDDATPTQQLKLSSRRWVWGAYSGVAVDQQRSGRCHTGGASAGIGSHRRRAGSERETLERVQGRDRGLAGTQGVALRFRRVFVFRAQRRHPGSAEPLENPF